MKKNYVWICEEYDEIENIWYPLEMFNTREAARFWVKDSHLNYSYDVRIRKYVSE